MTVSYILDDDLLKYLPYADAAVNLTTVYSDWTVGLSKAYADRFPKVYSMYRQEQEEDGLIKLGDVWRGKEDKNSPSVICAVVKILGKDWSDDTVTKETLQRVAKLCTGYKDVIMPITIIGDLEESMAFMREALSAVPDTHFWVGISKTRADEKSFKRDKIRVLLLQNGNLKQDEKLLNRIRSTLGNKSLDLSDIQIVSFNADADMWPDNGIPKIVYPKEAQYFDRLAMYSDLGFAFVKARDVDIRFNAVIQQLRKAGLDIEYVYN